LFLVEFVVPFLPAVLGKGRTNSGVKDMLEAGFVLACVLLEGPGSGEWILQGSGPADSSCLMFRYCSSMLQCLWLELVCLTYEDRNSSSTKISLLYGKIPVARNPALIFAEVAVKLRDVLIIPGQS
jgi:hypothetical protein